MRTVTAALLTLLFAGAAFAQRVICPPTTMSREYEERLQLLAEGISRDSAIVGQVVRAAGDLQDFQVNIAVQKALERVEEAQRRAAQKPMASPFFVDTLNGLRDTLRHARDQGSAADLALLHKEVLRRSALLQSELFREVDAARRERQALVTSLTRLQQLDQQLESSMIESLGTLFEFVRSGAGK